MPFQNGGLLNFSNENNMFTYCIKEPMIPNYITQTTKISHLNRVFVSIINKMASNQSFLMYDLCTLLKIGCLLLLVRNK